MLFSETLILAAVSLVFGLILGVALSKLAELGLAFFVESDAGYNFTVYPTAMGYTVLLFVGIFLLLFFKSVGQVGLSNPVELLRSESVGEKPPKANWVFGVLGIVILAAAYYISVTHASLNLSMDLSTHLHGFGIQNSSCSIVNIAFP